MKLFRKIGSIVLMIIGSIIALFINIFILFIRFFIQLFKKDSNKITTNQIVDIHPLLDIDLPIIQTIQDVFDIEEFQDWKIKKFYGSAEIDDVVTVFGLYSGEGGVEMIKAISNTDSQKESKINFELMLHGSEVIAKEKFLYYLNIKKSVGGLIQESGETDKGMYYLTFARRDQYSETWATIPFGDFHSHVTFLKGNLIITISEMTFGESNGKSRYVEWLGKRLIELYGEACV